VLANAACDVLQGQCLRSNGGLFYSGFREFFETLRTIDGNAGLSATLGRNGQQYFQSHYSWPVIERKYTDMLERLKGEPATRTIEPLPGWWSRRRRTLAPADEVVNRLPKGANRDVETTQPAARTSRPAAASPVRPLAAREARPEQRQPERRPLPDAPPPSTAAAPDGRQRGPRNNRPRSSDRPPREGRAPERRPRERQGPPPPANAEPPMTTGAPGETRQGRRRPSRGRRRPTGGR
jgi:hypothetical protein